MNSQTDILRIGLEKLTQRWNAHGQQLISKRLEGAISRNFCFECPGEKPLLLRIERHSASFRPLEDTDAPHATFRMSRDDWSQVFAGTWSVMSVVLGGRAPFPKHERRFVMQLSMLMQSLFLLEP